MEAHGFRSAEPDGSLVQGLGRRRVEYAGLFSRAPGIIGFDVGTDNLDERLQARIRTGPSRRAGSPHDNEIYLESLLIYKVGAYVNPYAALTLRTQFAPGYTYDTKPETEVSKFLDPAYFTQSAGVAYKPVPEFTTRIGAALREAVTSRYTRYATDLVNHTVHRVWTRGGLESVIELNANIAENIQFVARLELFAPFQSFDRVTVLNDYSIVAKVNKYISTGLSLNIINDVNVSARTQLKQGLALGLSYTLF